MKVFYLFFHCGRLWCARGAIFRLSLFETVFRFFFCHLEYSQEVHIFWRLKNDRTHFFWTVYTERSRGARAARERQQCKSYIWAQHLAFNRQRRKYYMHWNSLESIAKISNFGVGFFSLALCVCFFCGCHNNDILFVIILVRSCCWLPLF